MLERLLERVYGSDLSLPRRLLLRTLELQLNLQLQEPHVKNNMQQRWSD